MRHNYCDLNFSGKHLSELCKAEYPLLVKYCLWLLAELAVIAADIPEGSNLFFYCSITLFSFPFNQNLIRIMSYNSFS